MSDNGIVLFPTTSAALRAEKMVLAAGLTAKLVPTPRHLSSDCGIALRVGWSDAERTQHLLAEARVPTEGVFKLGDGA
jgi:hypothetical protein